METKKMDSSMRIMCNLLVLGMLCLSIVPHQCRKINQIDTSLRILEKKVAYQSYENALMQAELNTLKLTVEKFENMTEIGATRHDEKVTEHLKETEKSLNHHEKLSEMNTLLSALLGAFQVEKSEREKLKRTLNILEQSFKIELENLKSRINTLESKPVKDLEVTEYDHIKAIENNKDLITQKFDMLNESVSQLINVNLTRLLDITNNKAVVLNDSIKSNTNTITTLEKKVSSIETDVVKLSECLSKPHVSFFAQRSTSIPNLEPWDTLVFDSVMVNNGDAYSKNTGIFTASVDGVYLFHTHILGGDGGLEMSMQKNGENILFLYSDGEYFGADGNMIVVHLVKGDKIKVVKHGPWGKEPFYIHMGWTNFAGFLLHPL